MNFPREYRWLKKLPTGSTYSGTLDILGMAGVGKYTFPKGDNISEAEYIGGFDDGQFHGPGELLYKNGIIVKGVWNNGSVVQAKVYYPNGLQYDEKDWKYCRFPDRRFAMEYVIGLQPAGMTLETAEPPAPLIKPGQYDTCEGVYNPNYKAVFSYTDESVIQRIATTTEQKWIVDNCRIGTTKPLGPVSHLFERYRGPALVLEPEQEPPCKFLHDVVDPFKCCDEVAKYGLNEQALAKSSSCCPRK